MFSISKLWPFAKNRRGLRDGLERDVPELAATRLLGVRRFPRRRASALRRALLPLAVASLAALFAGGHLLLDRPPISGVLEGAVRKAISERFAGAHLTGHLRVGWLGTLALDGFRLPGPTPDDPPTLAAEQVIVHPSLWALLAGHLRPRALELRWVRLQVGPHGAWLRDLGRRLTAKRSGAPPAGRQGAAPPTVIVSDLFVDLPQSDSAAAPTALGPLAVRAQWKREDEALTFDVRGDLLEGKGGHFAAAGSLDRDEETTYQVSFESVALAALPPGLFTRETLSLDEGTFSGEVGGTLHGAHLTAHGALAVVQASIRWPRLAAEPVGPLNVALRGALDLDAKERTFALHQAVFTVNGGEALVEASLDRQRSFRLGARLAQVDMQAAIDSLPRVLRPPPQAPRVDGLLSADLEVEGTLGHWDTLEIRRADLDLSGLREAAAHDEVSSFLRQPFAFQPGGQEGDRREFEVGPGNPRFTPISSLPPFVPRAVVISEDAGFYGHHGFDFDEIKESIGRDLAEGHAVRGGSTLTQQLVKNLFLSREKTLARKIQEALITLGMEAALPKWRILEIYLNTIEWGPRIYGIGEASERYFGVRPQQLTPKQAAFLATIIPNPKRYYGYYFGRGSLTPAWEERVGQLLDKLAATGAIDAQARAEAAATPLVFHRAGAAAPPVPIVPEADEPF